MGKSALLQNMRWELCWLFANVLMSVGKKAAGKKNKFWVGKSFLIIHFICVLVVLYDLTQSWSSIAYNGKGLCEVAENRRTESFDLDGT